MKENFRSELCLDDEGENGAAVYALAGSRQRRVRTAGFPSAGTCPAWPRRVFCPPSCSLAGSRPRRCAVCRAAGTGSGSRLQAAAGADALTGSVHSGLTRTCLAGRADATSLRGEKRARAGGGAGAGAGRALAGQDEGESWAHAAPPPSLRSTETVPFLCVCAGNEQLAKLPKVFKMNTCLQ